MPPTKPLKLLGQAWYCKHVLSAVLLQSSLSTLVETRETLGHPSFTSRLMIYLLSSASQRLIVETANPVFRPRHRPKILKLHVGKATDRQHALSLLPAANWPCPPPCHPAYTDFQFQKPLLREHFFFCRKTFARRPQGRSGHHQVSIDCFYATLRIFFSSPF
jgi:hypothetical protein